MFRKTNSVLGFNPMTLFCFFCFFCCVGQKVTQWCLVWIFSFRASLWSMRAAAVAPASLPSSTMLSHFSPARASWRNPKYKSACGTRQSSAPRQCCAPHTKRPARLSSARGCTRTRMPAGPPTTPPAPSPEDRPCFGRKRVRRLFFLPSDPYRMPITQLLISFP